MSMSGKRSTGMLNRFTIPTIVTIKHNIRMKYGYFSANFGIYC